MTLIFHFRAKGIFENVQYEDLNHIDTFTELVRRLHKKNVHFIIIFHECENPKDLQTRLEKQCKTSLSFRSVPNSLKKAFSTLRDESHKKVQEFWFIEKDFEDKSDRLNGRFPLLSFSWFFTKDSNTVECIDESGQIITERKSFPPMSKVVTVEKYFFFFDCAIQRYDRLTDLKNYKQTLTEKDIGKTVIKVVPAEIASIIPPHISSSSGVNDWRGCIDCKPRDWDYSYCFPERYVLKDVEMEITKCRRCSTPTTLVCQKCKRAFYCSKTCQIDDFENHYMECFPNSTFYKKKIKSIKIESQEKQHITKYCEGWAIMEENSCLDNYAKILDF